MQACIRVLYMLKKCPLLTEIHPNVCIQIMRHDDATPEDNLSVGYLASKTAFEKRFDMLFDPPLTMAVPATEKHPAEKIMGQWLLATLGPPAPSLLQLRLKRALVQEKQKQAVQLIKQVQVGSITRS